VEVSGFTKIMVHMIFQIDKLIVPSAIALSVTTLAVLGAWVVLIAAGIFAKVGLHCLYERLLH
jgi:hypothetical protein